LALLTTFPLPIHRRKTIGLGCIATPSPETLYQKATGVAILQQVLPFCDGAPKHPLQAQDHDQLEAAPQWRLSWLK
jgi:hypothetical protein